MSAPLRAGVIDGAGVFGGYHAASNTPNRLDARVALAAVHDHHPDRHAEALAGPLWARPGLRRPGGEFPGGAVDIVSVVSPAVAHAEGALAALAAGKPVYVEKPVAVTSRGRRSAIVAAAAQAGSHRGRLRAPGAGLRHGHGPVRHPRAATRHMEAVRRGLPSPRNLDVSVVHRPDDPRPRPGHRPQRRRGRDRRGARRDIDNAVFDARSHLRRRPHRPLRSLARSHYPRAHHAAGLSLRGGDAWTFWPAPSRTPPPSPSVSTLPSPPAGRGSPGRQPGRRSSPLYEGMRPDRWSAPPTALPRPGSGPCGGAGGARSIVDVDSR